MAEANTSRQKLKVEADLKGLGRIFSTRTEGVTRYYFGLAVPGKTKSALTQQTTLHEIPEARSLDDAIKLSLRRFSRVPKNWATDFHDPESQKAYQSDFETLESYFGSWHPNCILDIGAGYAFVSEKFQRKYGTDLYLLDGDSEGMEDRQWREIGYGNASDFKFYSSKQQLIKSYDERELKYLFIDALRPQYPPIYYDLVCSFTSCGFHYPLKTYSDIIKQHTSDHSKIIIQFRKDTHSIQLDEAGFEIVHCLDPCNFIFEIRQTSK